MSTSLTVLQWFWSIHFFTCSREMVFTTVACLPSQWWSCKDCRPAWKCPTHLFTVAVASVWVPHTDDKSSIIYQFDLCFLIKNFTTALCSVITLSFSIIQKSSIYNYTLHNSSLTHLYCTHLSWNFYYCFPNVYFTCCYRFTLPVLPQVGERKVGYELFGQTA